MRKKQNPSWNLSRREFLKLIGSTAVVLSSPLPAYSEELFSALSKREFHERYRYKWSWDKVTLGTHNLNCWYQQNCCFHVFTKNGKVIREEQVGNYPQTNALVPDFNPRGCQKGCVYSELMYSEPRLRVPLKRAGKRGEGKWREVTWEEATTDIADKIIDTIIKEGSDAIVLDPGGSIMSQLAVYSFFSLMDKLDGVILDVNCELGDDQQGAAVTYGTPSSDRSADDYFYSDLVFIWGGNPAYTQIPNFHFLTEARYNGTEIIAVSPDMNASAMHADMWVPVKPGTDGALALSMAKVVLDEGLYKTELLKEQTDLPFLVRTDTRKFLRESDLKKGGSDQVLYRYNRKTQKIEGAGIDTLALKECDPALEGIFEIETLQGNIKVRPVFEFLKKKLADYSPEKMSAACGVSPKMIAKLARKLAKAKAATNTCTSGISKFYHGDLTMRSQILLFVLCGQLGRKGAGYVSASFLLADAMDNNFKRMEKAKEITWPALKEHGLEFIKNIFRGMDVGKAKLAFTEGIFVKSGMMVNSTLFWNLHGGVIESSGRSHEWDPYLKRKTRDYIDEALEKKWQSFAPVPPATPRILFTGCSNTLRRIRSSHRLREVLWPKLDLVIVCDLRMSSTALFADYVLPVCGAYEKTTVNALNTNPISPFYHTTLKAVANVGQSKDEWEIACLIAKKVQERAIARKFTVYKGRLGKKRRLDNLYFRFTQGGRILEKESEKLSQDLVEESTNLSDISWEDLKKKGYVRFSGLGKNLANLGNACDIKEGETISPHTWHTEKKLPWTTLTGRIQFYIDHDWYLELKEELPMYKEPPKAGGDYPLFMTGGHARWSIHSTWRSDPLMLRLQRGEPCLWISPEDAKARNIQDGDKIKVFNDIGSFTTFAKVAPIVMPGQTIMYHAWENYQFEEGIGYRNVQASPFNPIELVGDYPFFRPVFAIRQPGQNDRDTRVEVRRVG